MNRLEGQQQPSKLFLKTSFSLIDLQKSPSYLSNLVRAIYTCASLIFLVPFSTTFDPTTGHYRVINRRFIQVIVLTIHVIILVSVVSTSIIANLGQAQNFTDLFRSLMVVPWFFCIFNLFRSLWRNQRAVELFLGQLDKICHSMTHLGVILPSLRSIQLWTACLLTFYLAWCLTDITLFDLELDRVSFETRFIQLANQINSLFLNNDVTSKKIGDLSLLQWTLTCGSMLTMWSTEFAIHLADILFLTYALVNYVLIHSFVQHLTSTTTSRFSPVLNYRLSLVMQIFDQFCHLTQIMNDTVGSIVFCSCFGLLPFYSHQLILIFERDFVRGIQFYLYALIFTTSLILAAEANSKITGLINWLQDSQADRQFQDVEEKLNFHEHLLLTLSQVDRNEIGIKGKSFTITYGFVGNVWIASLVVTYAIVIVQLQSAAPK